MTDTIRQRRHGLALLTAAVSLAGMAAAATPAQASPAAGLRSAGVVPGGAKLNGVYCTAAASCWAVGSKESAKNALLNQVVRWNGKKWTAIAAPSPGGSKTNDSSELVELDDVSCTSASSCWAVGDDGNFGIGSPNTDNLVLHWNGKKWSKVRTPNPAGISTDDVNSLAAVRCSSVKNCWAAGSEGSIAGPGLQFNEMLHWNGSKWSTADVPSPTDILPGAYSWHQPGR